MSRVRQCRKMVDSGCRGEQMERKGGGDLRTRACARSRVGMYTHTRICTHARMHTISHMCGEIQVYAENSSRGNGLVARPSHAPGLAAYTRTKRERESRNSSSSSSDGRGGSTRAAALLLHRHGRSQIRAGLASGLVKEPVGNVVACHCIRRSAGEGRVQVCVVGESVQEDGS